MLSVTLAAWATIQVARFVLPPLLPEIRADLSLTRGQAGVALTTLQVTYALAQYPSGRLSDAWGRATIVVPALIVLALGCLFLGTAVSFLVLLLGATVFGVGKGLFAIPSRALLSDLFVERRGRALGLYAAGSDLGGALASGLSIAVLVVATWRAPFVPLAGAFVALTALFAFWSRESYTVHRTSLDVVGTTRRVLATPRQRWTILAYTLFFFMVNGMLSFYPAYLQESKGLSPELASGSFGLLFLFGVGIKPLAGAVSDRFPRRWVAVAGMVVSAAALSWVLVVNSLTGVVAATILFAVGYKAQSPVADAILLDAAPDDKMGADLGAARTVFLGIGSLGPAFVGVTADAYDYTVAFAALVGCLLAAAAIFVWQARTSE